MRAQERFVPWSELRGALNTLEQACESFDYEAIKRFIERLVEGADLAEQLMDLSGQMAATVVPLPRGRGTNSASGFQYRCPDNKNSVARTPRTPASV